MKEKLNPLDEKSTEESTVKQKIYSIEYFVYYKLLWNKKNKFKHNSGTFSSSKFPEE